jgi:hypothetical protein
VEGHFGVVGDEKGDYGLFVAEGTRELALTGQECGLGEKKCEVNEEGTVPVFAEFSPIFLSRFGPALSSWYDEEADQADGVLGIFLTTGVKESPRTFGPDFW